MPFGPVDPHSTSSRSRALLDRWRATTSPRASASARQDGEPWVFYEGPPTANGRPGLHHVWARVFKDLYPRFQTMRGRRVPRKGGWDCHGLPVELEVEKALGLPPSTRSRPTASPSSTSGAATRSTATSRTGRRSPTASGVWIDTADAYWTLDNDYIESVWWLVKQMWDHGPALRGSPGRPLLRALRHRAVVARGRPGLPRHRGPVGLRALPRHLAGRVEGADLLVWTTTPWTLVSNVGAAVGADIAYVRVRAGVGGATCCSAERPPGPALPRGRGGTRLTRRASWWAPLRAPVRPARCPPAPTLAGGPGDFVSTDDGSGIVHLAPPLGEDDAVVGRAEGLPVSTRSTPPPR